MADLIMIVDTALAEVPVNIMPLLDDTDFKTRETAVAFNAAGMDLVWNFVTTGGAFTQTAVTPTSAGDYDWTHQGDGMYTIEIPASGGASINNDTEGFGWFTGLVTGVLPWRGPVIMFSTANVVNSLVNGSDLFDVSVTQWLGTAAATPTVGGVPEVDVTHWIGTAAATPTTGGVPEVDVTFVAGAAVSTTSAQIGVNVVQISTDATAADNAELFFDNTGFNASASTIGTASAIGTGGIATTSFAAGAIDAAAIAASAIGASEIATGAIDADALAADAVDEILDDTIGDGTLTVRQALRVLVAGMAAKLSGAATTTITIRNVADTADVIVATVDASGNRTATTVTP